MGAFFDDMLQWIEESQWVDGNLQMPEPAFRSFLTGAFLAQHADVECEDPEPVNNHGTWYIELMMHVNELSRGEEYFPVSIAFIKSGNHWKMKSFQIDLYQYFCSAASPTAV